MDRLARFGDGGCLGEGMWDPCWEHWNSQWDASTTRLQTAGDESTACASLANRLPPLSFHWAYPEQNQERDAGGMDVHWNISTHILTQCIGIHTAPAKTRAYTDSHRCGCAQIALA